VSTPTLTDKLVALHGALDGARIPHAFGGAIALAYCTGAPRGTIDIDLNVFVEPTEARRVFADLPIGVTADDNDVAAATTDGQVRLFWGTTPVDLFFRYHPFHHDVARRVRSVPFGPTVIPVLSCEDLLVFKAFFSRTKDWADIEAMVATDAVDLPLACERVATLLGADHPSYLRLLNTVRTPPNDDPRPLRLP
jgi:hypothetical protein